MLTVTGEKGLKNINSESDDNVNTYLADGAFVESSSLSQGLSWKELLKMKRY